MLIERMANESPLDYHKRLVYGKLVDKTLADMDYSELAEAVYGQSYSSDVARRMLYGSRKTLELMDNERTAGIEDGDVREQMEYKLEQIRKEAQKLRDQRREYMKLISSEGRAEHLHDIIISAANKLSDEIGCMYGDDPLGLRYLDNDGDGEAVLVLSDWHYGLKVSNVFNTYDTKICRERIRNTVHAAIDRIALHHCNVLHIVVLGDLFHGAVHTSARVASEEVVCEQIMHVSEILAQSIYELSKYVSAINVYMTYGNHGRTVQVKKDNLHNDNMEKIINWWLIERFKDNDKIHIAPVPENEFIAFNVCGHAFCATHGDLDTVQSSPRLLATLFQKKYGIDLEYILLGDKHHRESFNELGITAMLCGSLCGSDDYANEKRLYAEPSQMLLIVNEEDGVDAEYRLHI